MVTLGYDNHADGNCSFDCSKRNQDMEDVVEEDSAVKGVFEINVSKCGALCYGIVMHDDGKEDLSSSNSTVT